MRALVEAARTASQTPADRVRNLRPTTTAA